MLLVFLEVMQSGRGFMKANLSPLMQACCEGNASSVKTLLSSYLDVNKKNSDGNTAIWFACYSNCIDIIHMLASHGADINHQNNDGATPLIYAASTGKSDVVACLLSLGANKDLQTADGFTALELSASYSVMRLLKNQLTGTGM